MKKVCLLSIAYGLLAATSLHAQVNRPQPSPSPAPSTQPAVLQLVDCGCEDKPLPEVLAVVNGIRVSKLDIDETTQKRIKDLQQQVVEARQREVELQINSFLLDAEAKKRGVSATKLLEAEVVGKATPPTEADARAFHEQNKARIGSEFIKVKDEIMAYLAGQRQEEAAKKFAERLRASASLRVSSEVVTPGSTPAARARILATVNGKNITSGDVEESLKPVIFSVQEAVYGLRKQQVELRINDTLLEQEAKRRAITTTALLAAEVTGKVPAITETEAQKFYNENKGRINGEFPQIKNQIIDYLKEQALQNAQSVFAGRLRSVAQIQVFLTAPVQPLYQIAVDDQPARGNPNAAVTVVEFTDFQCLTCSKQHPVVERLVAEYGTRVKFVVRDFPLAQHDNAGKAAEAAEAAREQGKYWDYTALLFRNQSALQIDKLKQYASTLGLDRARFDSALDSGKFAEKIQRDRLDGQKIGVAGAPTFYVNGRRVIDLSYEGLKAAIESNLKSR